VEAAGGLASDADQDKVNLADTVRDGQQLYIPHLNTPAPPSPTPMSGTTGNSTAIGASSGARADGLVNINTASTAELQTLHGIGPAFAERIIAYRQANGPFADPADIKKVKGIGDAVYEQNKARITVR
jgi:competence protein ComEA